MKRILLLALLVLAAAVSLAPALAADTVTIEGVSFHLPDGYTEDSAQQSVNISGSQDSLEYKMSGKVFVKGNNAVSVMVEDFGDYNVSDDVISQVGDAKTLKNVKGYMKEVGGAYAFTYLKDGKVVIISSTDENAIGEFLG